MLKINDFFSSLNDLAPIKISELAVERGEYDNSGIIIKAHDGVERVLFSLDLSDRAIKRAKALSCDTIVTHHPAIYYPIKKLDFCDETTSPVLSAAACGMNVISMHLNLDMAENGIDACLANALGAKSYRLVENLDEKYGYGREFALKKTLAQIKRETKIALKTQKIITYGKKTAFIDLAASFCGGGSSHAIGYAKAGGKADLIATSDMPHHIIKELVEGGKCVMLIPHYAAEEVGFKTFFESASRANQNKIQTYYFCDKRFL